MLESVRARLTFWYAAVLAIFLVVMSVASYFTFRRTTMERSDNDLMELSDAFLVTLGTEVSDAGGREPIKTAAEEAIHEHRLRDHVYAVFDAAGEVEASSDQLNMAMKGKEPSAANLLDSSEMRKFVGASSPEREFLNLAGGRNGYRGIARRFTFEGHAYAVGIFHSLHPQEEMLEEIRETFAWVIPLAILLASAGGYFLARKSLEPVLSMSQRASRISAANLHERLPVKNERDELGALATAFNHLLDRLEQSFERQRRFMADASHELRTPVAILRGEAEVALSRQSRTPEEYRESLGVLHGEAQRLTHIVDDLFTLTRADAGQYPLQRQGFYLDELVADCVHSARTLAGAKNIKLSGDTPEECAIYADESLLRRMVLNLVDNAIKYTPEGGKVTVSCYRQGPEYAISVRDSGPGIAEDLQPRIFERFFRADTARSRSEGGGTGAGLGLAISRWIAEAHEGRLELTCSDASGSTFSALLPEGERQEETAAKPINASFRSS